MKKVDAITLTVAENLAVARRAKGWTQQDLANALGCSKHAVMTWETCRNEIANETLLRIAAALGKKWLWFYQSPEVPDIFDTPSEDWQLQQADNEMVARKQVKESTQPKLTDEQLKKWNVLSVRRGLGFPDSAEDERFVEELRKVVAGGGEDCLRFLNEACSPLFIEQFTDRIARARERQVIPAASSF